MKPNRHLIQCLLFLLLLLPAGNAFAQQALTPKGFYEWMSVQSDTIDYRWLDPKYIVIMNRYAQQFLRESPDDPYVPYSFTYTVFAFKRTRSNPPTTSQIDSVRNEVIKYTDGYKNKGALFYRTIASSFNLLYIMYAQADQLESARQMIDKAEDYALTALNSDSNRGSDIYKASVLKLVGIYNNKATFLYRATHHLDSEVKRKEAGPIIARTFEKADSLAEIFEQIAPEQMDVNYYDFILINSNKYVVYGGYYIDTIKAEQSFKKSQALIAKYCKGTEDIYCEEQKKQLEGARTWVYFSRNEYEKAIKYGLRTFQMVLDLEKKLQETKTVLSSFVKSDVLIALTQSYYHKSKMDSAIYYGNLYLGDTVNVKDYSALSEVSSILAELYMEKDVQRSKELLQISKDAIRKSQADQIRTKLIREGEIRQLNQSFERIVDVTEWIRQQEELRTKLIKILFYAMTVICIILVVYIFRRLRLQQQSLVQR